MSLRETELTIIGGGAIGASIFAELIRRGFANIALIDEGRRSTSATSQSGGMLRVFHESAEHVDLAIGHRRRSEILRRERILTSPPAENGNLYFFHESRLPAYAANLRKMESADSAFEVLDAARGSALFPQFRWQPGELAIFEPRAGHAAPAAFTQDLLKWGSAQGGEVIEDREVKRICQYAGRYRLATSESSFTTSGLILAGGARLLPRFNDLGLVLPLSTRVLTTHWARKTDPAAIQPNYFDRETLDYGRLGEGEEVALGDPASERLRVKSWQNDFRTQSALDCYAPARAGLLGSVAGLPGLFVATGWGGTGFKFALEIAARVADAVERDFAKRKVQYV